MQKLNLLLIVDKSSVCDVLSADRGALSALIGAVSALIGAVSA